jgi:hypothetical protein
MATQARTVVSVSDNTRVSYGKRGWRVRTFRQPADWNAMGITLDEQWFRSETRAMAHAADMASQHGGTVQR